MTRVRLAAVATLASFGLLAPGAAFAQLGDVCALRGQVLDEQGAGIPDVKIELEYKGETRQKIVRTMTTDKKGKFLRSGLKSGSWQFTLTKAGLKTYRFETALTTGGIDEIPPITMSPAPAEGTPGAGLELPPSAQGGEEAGKKAEKVKELGDTYNRGVEAMHAGQMDDAETLFKQVIAEFPDLAAAHHNLGYVYEKKGNIEGAEAEFRKSMQLQPKESESYVALATLFMTENRSDEAMQTLQDAAGGFAQDAKFQFALGALAFNSGRSEDAEAAFAKVAELDPSNAEVQFYLGSLAVSRNEVPDAVAHLEKYVAAAPPGAPNVATAKALLATLQKAK
jgi:tetratricopeptide (TPR) repeat protein